jgi:hypothetical protein
MVEFYYEKIEEKKFSLLKIDKKADEKLPSVSLLRACFIEIDPKPLIPDSIWHELIIQFLSGKYQPNVRLISPSKYQTDMTKRYGQTIEEYHLQWTNMEYQELQKMFDDIHAIAAEHAKTTQKTIWSYLDEYIILALQCISIEKQLVKNWIYS